MYEFVTSCPVQMFKHYKSLASLQAPKLHVGLSTFGFPHGDGTDHSYWVRQAQKQEAPGGGP